MSDQNLQNTVNNKEPVGFEELVLKINRETNELVFTDPKTGKEISARFEEQLEELPPPLSVDEFRAAWERLQKLGITWNTDVPPTPVLQKGGKRNADFNKEYLEVQKQYPSFPYDLGNVVLHALLHPSSNTKIDKKVEIIRELLTQEYRAEFFFKYAIKVPYFEDIDWEIVIKAYERAVHSMPKIAYALLRLTLKNPVNSSLSIQEAANEYREPDFVTVAANEELIDRLIDKLNVIKQQLLKAQRAANGLSDTIEPIKEESDNESATT